jgi:cyclopropane fatty-acyl-phospholipid synthase-like methyltransferase
MSRLLAPHAKEIVGVDVSQGMVDQFNKRVEEENISREAVYAVRAELKDDESELDGKKFDLIVVSCNVTGLPQLECSLKI